MSVEADAVARPPIWPAKPELTCWLLDTRSIWQGQKIDDAAPEMLKLLSPEEQKRIKSKVFIHDARLALGSALLKRLFIRKTLGVPWSKITFHRKGDPKHGKPCFTLKENPAIIVEFNVSHQNGLVALVGAMGADVELGVDIVCVNERDDYRTIDREGFDGWIDIYEDMFSLDERWDMKYNVDRVQLLDGTEITPAEIGRGDRCCVRDQELIAKAIRPNGNARMFNSDLLIEAKLRRFYTFWCYKEAFIKLSGEALLAPWLRQLEFRNVHSPRPGTVARCSTHGSWGEKVTDVEVFLHGQMQDVCMEIQSFEEDYMIATAARTSGRAAIDFPGFQKIDIEQELARFAG